MKKLAINGNTCYEIYGQLFIETEGDPIFAMFTEEDTIKYILGMSSDKALSEIEKWGEDISIDDISSIGIQEWAIKWAE